MEILLENVTDDEVNILIENDVDWIPDDILGDTKDVSISGTRQQINHVLKLLGRKGL